MARDFPVEVPGKRWVISRDSSCGDCSLRAAEERVSEGHNCSFTARGVDLTMRAPWRRAPSDYISVSVSVMKCFFFIGDYNYIYSLLTSLNLGNCLSIGF